MIPVVGVQVGLACRFTNSFVSYLIPKAWKAQHDEEYRGYQMMKPPVINRINYDSNSSCKIGSVSSGSPTMHDLDLWAFIYLPRASLSSILLGLRFVKSSKPGLEWGCDRVISVCTVAAATNPCDRCAHRLSKQHQISWICITKTHPKWFCFVLFC